MPRRSLAEQLRQRREAIGLSQAELAQRLGLKQQQVSKWESGTTLPQVGRLPAVAAALDMKVTDLYAWVAEASQAVATSAKRQSEAYERILAAATKQSERFQLFADKYEELGHTYAANHELLSKLVEQNDALMRRLDDLEARLPPRREDPPPELSRRRRS